MNWIIIILLWTGIGALLLRTIAWSKFQAFMDELVSAAPEVQAFGRRNWSIALYLVFSFAWPAFMLMPDRRHGE